MAKSKSSKKNANSSLNGTEITSPTMPLEMASDAAVETTSRNAAEVTPEETITAPRRATRKPGLVRTDSRSNLFPINLEDEIRQLAYLLSERRGFEPGHETEDWFNAEHEVMERYHHTATA